MVDTISQIFSMWQVNVLLSIFFSVLFFQSYKAAVRNAKNDGAATILLQTIASFSILIFVPFYSLNMSTDPKFWVLMFIASVFYAVNDRLNATARKHLPVSTYSIISQLSTVFLILIGIVVFQEDLLINKLIGAGLIVLGNIIVVYKRGQFKVNQYFKYAVLATVMISIAMSIDIGISQQFNLPIYIFLTLMLPAVMIAVVQKIKIKDIKVEYNSPDRKYYYLAGIAWGLLIMFMLRSFWYGEVTTVTQLTATTVLLNVIIAFIIYKEREDLLKKIVAGILVVIGVILTVL